MLLRGVGDHYECVRRNLSRRRAWDKRGLVLFAPRMAPWWDLPVHSRETRRNRRARKGSLDRRIARRFFEQGPAPRQGNSDLLLAPALPHIGAAVVACAIVIAGAVASLRI